MGYCNGLDYDLDKFKSSMSLYDLLMDDPMFMINLLIKLTISKRKHFRLILLFVWWAIRSTFGKLDCFLQDRIGLILMEFVKDKISYIGTVRYSKLESNEDS